MDMDEPGARSDSKPHKKRRSRPIASCLECRRRKLKCDRVQPCSICARLNKDCRYQVPAPAPHTTRTLPTNPSNGRRNADSATDSIEEDLYRPTGPVSRDPNCDPRPMLDKYGESAEPTPMALFDANYSPIALFDSIHSTDGGVSESNDIPDAGFAYGKMRLTDRLGGFFRPLLAQEIMSTLIFIDKKAKEQGQQLYPTLETSINFTTSDFDFGVDALLPSLGLGFQSQLGPFDLRSTLPSRLASDRLAAAYFANVNAIAYAVHRPSFETRYQRFWDDVFNHSEPSKSLQAFVLAVLFSGAVSLVENEIFRDFGVTKQELVSQLKSAVEHALDNASFLHATKMETLQALVIYLIPQCRNEISRAHSVLVGAAIRLAQCLGLHCDGSSVGFNPLETHVRRVIWHQLCFLDVRTFEAQGPRPQIRADDYDTKLPLNVSDQDLHASGPAPKSQDRWTDATFSLIRFECHAMHRSIWYDHILLEKRQTTLTAVRRKIKNFHRRMASTYDHLLDERVPLQKCAKILKNMMMNRCYVMVLQRYHGSVKAKMPEKLVEVLTESALTYQEAAIALDTDPHVSPWRWYSGAYNQYQPSLMILIWIALYPDDPRAERIWQVVDFVFEADPAAPRDGKARRILIDVQRKIAAYQLVKGLAAPPATAKWAHMGIHLGSNGYEQPTDSAVDAPPTPLSYNAGTRSEIAPVKGPGSIASDGSVIAATGLGLGLGPSRPIADQFWGFGLRGFEGDIDWGDWDMPSPAESG